LCRRVDAVSGDEGKSELPLSQVGHGCLLSN
jgi:hypothetical protein